jgi:ubiquinone biosynthesis protein COQ4
MTDTASLPEVPPPQREIPPLQREIPPPSPEALRTHWRLAWRSLRELIDDPDDTAKAIDLNYAIGGREFEASFQRFLAGPYSRDLLAHQRSLSDALGDRDALARMPDDSLGRAYLQFQDANGFQSLALRDLQHEVELRWEADEGVPQLDPVRRWFRDRFILSHDLEHVLTGYGTDDLGEATLLAFGLGQRPGRGVGLLTFGAALEVFQHKGLAWLRYALRAWRRGRRAAFLPELPWEDLLPVRLDAVRALLRLETPLRAHPGGIWCEMLRES